jgi:prepilin-type N-terminal cleavage/methylation domain-containing protein
MQRQDAFTMIETLIVLQIIAILLAVAVPQLLGFKDRANKRASASDVRNAIIDAENYWADPAKGAGTYQNMTLTLLRSANPALKLDNVIVSTDNTTYCLQKSVGGFTSLVIRGVRPTNGGLVQENVAGNCPAAGSL